MTEILIDGREVIDVNNTVLNVVLNQKYRLAKSKDIALYFQVNDLSGLWMKDAGCDVISLSNLLDNAIEACEKLDCNKVIRRRKTCKGKNNKWYFLSRIQWRFP